MNIPDKIRPYLEAALRGETIEYQRNTQWFKVETLAEFHDLAFVNATLRIKPKTITLVGIEFPEPLRVAPEFGAYYYVVDIDFAALCVRHRWTNHEADKRWLHRGIIQATEQGAKDQARAMLQAVANACEKPAVRPPLGAVFYSGPQNVCI